MGSKGAEPAWGHLIWVTMFRGIHSIVQHVPCVTPFPSPSQFIHSLSVRKQATGPEKACTSTTDRATHVYTDILLCIVYFHLYVTRQCVPIDMGKLSIHQQRLGLPSYSPASFYVLIFHASTYDCANRGWGPHTETVH